MDRSRVGIVIPALNEAATIATVVTTAAVHGVPVVVDDGSTDDTARLAAAAGAVVVSHPVNRGYDGALNSGFAKAHALGLDCMVTLDADGQHDPAVLPRMLQMIGDGADVVIGIRSRQQRLAEHVFALTTRLMFGIQDPLCGMKAYRASVYAQRGHFDAYQSIGTELALFAARRGLRVQQVPFQVRERDGQPRFGRIWSANWRIFRAMLIFLVRR